jgi:4-hydroxyphenylacetate 3-monooxygenase
VIIFTIAGTNTTIKVNNPTVVVAGYTGRDEESVRHHIEELAAIGVKPPESIPSFFLMDRGVLTQRPDLTVNGIFTSGEVEPVLIRCGGQLYLSVGSDHTDRDMERESVFQSKAICPKPVANEAILLTEHIFSDWDAITAESYVDGVLYQQGSLVSLKIPTEVLDLFCTRYPEVVGDIVMFCGTWPLINGEFIAGDEWKISLTTPNDISLSHRYKIGLPNSL